MKRPTLLPIFTAALLVVLFFFSVLIGQKAIFKDQSYEFHYQAASYIKDQIRQGDFPLWNQRAAMGEPFAGYPEFSVFYPLFLLAALVFPPVFAVNFVILLHYLLIAAFTAALARRMNISAAGATVAGISFAFCGYLLLLHTELQSLGALLALPASLYFFERYRHSRKVRFIIGTGFALGLGHLAGGIQYSYYIDMFFVFWAIFVPSENSIKSMNRLPRDLASMAGALLFSVLVAAIVLLPTFGMVQQSLRSQVEFDRITASDNTYPALGRQIALKNLPGFVYPKDPTANPAQTQPVYPGALTLLLVLCALVFGKDRRRYALAIACALALLLAAGKNTPLLSVLYSLPIPGMSMFKSPIRIIALFAFASALLAGMGVDVFFANAAKRRKFFRWTAVAALLLVGVLALQGNAFYMGAVFIAAGLGIFLASTHFPKRSGQMLIAAQALILLAGYPILDLLPMDQVKQRTEPTPITKALAQEKVGRVIAFNAQPTFDHYNHFDLAENTGMGREVDLIDGNSSLHSERYLRFTAAGNDVSPRRQYARSAFYMYPALRKMANLTHEITTAESAAHMPGVTVLATHKGNSLVRLAAPAPVRLLFDFQCSDSLEDSAQKLIRLRDTEPMMDIVEDEPCMDAAGASDPPGSAQLARRTADRIEIDVAIVSPRYVFVSEGYAPGWKALMGNQKLKIVPADLGFMAVKFEQPATGRLVLKYNPPYTTVGAVVSLFAFCFGILIVTADMRSTRRRSERHLQ